MMTALMELGSHPMGIPGTSKEEQSHQILVFHLHPQENSVGVCILWPTLENRFPISPWLGIGRSFPCCEVIRNHNIDQINAESVTSFDAIQQKQQ